jgi:dTDP-4-amino-4,6-dideoxygalactose transaminase
VVAVGAIPIIAEIDESLMLDPADVEAKITPRTKAVIPVHMVGLPADMNGIMRVARRHGVKVLEDGCQADGGSYRGKRIGAIGQVGAFSFNYYKNVTCGEGGAVVTNDPAIYERAMVMHDPGTAFRQHRADLSIEPFIGMAFRMNEIQSAVLRAQLKRIDGLLAKLRANKQKVIAGIAGAGLKLVKQNDPEGECSTTLALTFDTAKQARLFMTLLGKQGMGTHSPIDSGRHVYSNWDPILQQRGGHHPAMNAFRMPANRASKVKYSKTMCPRTTDLLSRAVFIGIAHSWKAADVRKRVRAIQAAAHEMATR